MVIDNKYNFGDVVYLITDREQLPRQVVSIEIFKNGEYVYNLISGTNASRHYDFEMSPTKLMDFV